MTKTLEEAIGCWTVNMEYNSLPALASLVKNSANRCSRITKRSTPIILAMELEILRKRAETILELTNDAIRRCREIIEKGEVG